jgi:signal transduction histidine kinase/ligand-binding sensor domain-containing protein/AraC-like DNA-binding protein/ActR/RegA family two-component response regulator
VLLCDKKGFIWVGTSQGLDKIEVANVNGEIKNINHYNIKRGLSSNYIQTLFEDTEGNLWIGTQNGLNVLNVKTNSIQKYFNNLQEFNCLSNSDIRAIYCDKRGYAWIGTAFGLNKLHIASQKFERYYLQPSNAHSLLHNTVRSITEDIKGRLIVGTLGGLSIFNQSKNEFENYHYRLNDIYGLNSDFVNCLYTDKEGNVWVGTESGGINLYNIFQKQFEFFENEPGNPNSLSHNTINSILDDDKNIWIGTAGGGLNKYDKETGNYKHYKNVTNNRSSISSDFITALFKDKDNNLWVGSWGGGLNKLTPSSVPSGNFSRYSFSTSPNAANSLDFISSILNYSEDEMWIGTLGGLILYDRKTGQYIPFEAKNSKTKITQVGCIEYDKENNLWVGTITGLYRILKNKEKAEVKGCEVELYHNIKGDKTSIRGDYVISIHCDKKGRIWFGTYGNGLNLFNPPKNKGEKGTFTSFTEADGLSNNVVYSILEDNSGNLWLSTDNGLSKFNPETKTFKNYYKTDGLQSNQFYWAAYFKNKAGKMYFGSMKGVNAFFPDSIQDMNFVPRTIVTDFKIYNQSVNVGEKYNGKIVLSKSITTSQKIKLSYKSNEFTFEFSALLYNQPENIRYMYKLDGFDKQWIYVNSSRRFASYTNIGGGDYTFMVKAVNELNNQAEEPYKIKLIIVPPFWETWWFVLIMVVLVTTSVISFYRYRIYSLKRQTKKLEALVEKRTVKIEEQKEELVLQANKLKESNLQLEKRKELIEGQKEQLEFQNIEILQQRDKLIELNKKVQIANQQQLNFFTHISHEFRTPLTLIIAPTEQILKETTDTTVKNKLNLIYKNAQRLLHLINQLMEVRKVETGKTELKTSKDDIVRFVEGISLSFISLANQRQIHYQVSSDKKQLDVYFDHEIVENILYNILSNAFKYTPEKGIISLNISTSNGKQELKEDVAIIDRHLYKHSNIADYVKIEVQDNGIGIASNQIKDIFRRFYRIHSHESAKVSGSGIGLYLTRELVKAHKGLLYINSKTGVGTTIKILLPIGTNHLISEEIKAENYSLAKDSTLQVQLLSEQLNPPQNSEIQPQTENQNLIAIKEKQELEKSLVLVVDDDHDLCDFIADSLKDSFRIIKAYNGKEGIEQARLHAPDVIISDVMMPETDGLELCSRIKTELETSHIPVILLTARSEADNYIEGLESGADDYISKPFNIRIIEAKVKSLIENRKKLKSLFTGSLIPVPREITTTRSDEVFLNKAIKLVEENIADPDWGVQDMASQLCISRSLLHKKLTAIVDQSAVDFITAIRLKKSALLMHQNMLNISEVAYSVGFNDPKYFSKCFKKHFGKTPTEYANQ